MHLDSVLNSSGDLDCQLDFRKKCINLNVC